MPIAKPIENRLVRCAIYTRKSTSTGLDMPVNSLETQREVCRAYIKCQEHRHWVELPQAYDDGGYSGGSLQRPALKRLIDDIESGQIDIVVIYKIDRLSRSLTDFIRLMDVLDRYGASFVSVTQTFDTSDSMGRLVLNILLTFAQFERELMSERVRDRYAERRRRGLHTGGTAPVGYLVKRGGKLVPDPERAEVVRDLFLKFPEVSAIELARRLQAQGFVTRMYVSRHGKTRGGQKFYGTAVLRTLRNPIYAGYCYYRGELMKAQVEPLITLEQWQLVQEVIRTRFAPVRDPTRNFLLGIIHDEQGRRMKILATGSGRSGRVRYYRSEHAGWARGTTVRKVMVNADRVEKLAISALQALLVDRIKLKETILALGIYSAETGRILRSGQIAARRMSLMDNAQLRELLVALVPRAEVTKSQLRMLVCSYELGRYLAWDGLGVFQKAAVRPRGADRFRLIYAPAFLVCGHPYFAIPLMPCDTPNATPLPELVALIEEAAELRQLVFHNRKKSVRELARQTKRGESTFARVLRLNYLAPDIQAAIIDGTQPADLTPHKLLHSSLPLDWEQQRQLMGFPPCPS